MRSLPPLLVFAALCAGNEVGAAPGYQVPYLQDSPDGLYATVPKGTHLLEASFTLVAPVAVDRTKFGDLSLWFGVDTETKDLVQTITDSDPLFSCPQDLPANDWCVYSYTLLGAKTSSASTEYGVAQPGQSVTSTYSFDEQTGIWQQQAYIDDGLVSTFSTPSGRAVSFNTAMECCCDKACGPAPAHRWINGHFKFNKPVSRKIFEALGKAKMEGLTTTDKGITWTISSLSIQGHDFE